MTLRVLRILVVAALLGAFVYYVWPGRWRYDHMTIGEDTYPVRIDRFGGRAYILLPGDGWTPAEEAGGLQDGADQSAPNRI